MLIGKATILNNEKVKHFTDQVIFFCLRPIALKKKLEV